MANKIQLIIEADDKASGQFKKLVSGLERGLSSVDSENKKLIRSSTQLGNTLKWAGGILATYFGARAIGGLTRGIIQTGAGFEKMRIQLDTLTRGQGQETLDALNEWAKDMPVNTEKAVEAFIRMKAMGLDPTIEDMTTLVDTTSALGGDSGTLEGISRALGQIQTKGKASAEELMQLAERGVPAYRILQEQLGLTAEQVANIVNEGISGTVAVRALLRGLAEEFGGQSARIQDTWVGMVEALRSEWVDFQKKVAEAGGLDTAKQAIGGLLDTIRQLSEEGTLDIWAESISRVLSTVIGAVDGAILAFNDLFGTGIQKQIDDTREKMEATKKAIAEGGVWEEGAEGAGTLIRSVEQLRLDLFYLEQQEISLIKQLTDNRQKNTELKDSNEEVKDSVVNLAASIKEQKEAWKEWNNEVKAWNETYNQFKTQIGEEREQLGEFGDLFGPQTFFPSQEEWDEYRTVYNENLGVLAEDNQIHYEGLSTQGKAYLDKLVKDTEKSRKSIEKDDKKHQQILQQQAMQTAQLKIQTAQLVAQTMIAIAGEESGALFYLARGLAFVQAIISAWVAYTAALAHPPGPPTTIPVAKWTLASGLAAAALIAATTFTGKQEGGFLKGGSGVRDDIYIGTVGQTSYLAQGGEFIVNRDAARENADLLEAINEGASISGASGGGSMVIHNYITIELDGEPMKEFTKTTIYDGTKAGEPIVHTRGIVTP